MHIQRMDAFRGPTGLGSGCTTEVQFPDFSLMHREGQTTFSEFRPKDWAWAVNMPVESGFQ